MSFRKEEKVIFHISEYSKLKNLIFSSNGKKIYPTRHIKSIYFDNNKNQMFIDSEEGSLPRKKLRIRTYPKNNIETNWFFEKKINSVEGKFKTTKNLKEALDEVKRSSFSKRRILLIDDLELWRDEKNTLLNNTRALIDFIESESDNVLVIVTTNPPMSVHLDTRCNFSLYFENIRDLDTKPIYLLSSSTTGKFQASVVSNFCITLSMLSLILTLAGALFINEYT